MADYIIQQPNQRQKKETKPMPIVMSSDLARKRYERNLKKLEMLENYLENWISAEKRELATKEKGSKNKT